MGYGKFHCQESRQEEWELGEDERKDEGHLERCRCRERERDRVEFFIPTPAYFKTWTATLNLLKVKGPHLNRF